MIEGSAADRAPRAGSELLRIEPLADHPGLIEVVARWHWNEWGNADPDGSLDSWIDGLRSRSGRERVPISWVGLKRLEPVGSVALIDNDMSTRPDLGPWLSGLYVVPELRRQGIGTALTRHCEREAFRLGARRLYLYSSVAEWFYRRLDYVVVDRDRYEQENVAVMVKALAQSSTDAKSP